MTIKFYKSVIKLFHAGVANADNKNVFPVVIITDSVFCYFKIVKVTIVVLETLSESVTVTVS